MRKTEFELQRVTAERGQFRPVVAVIFTDAAGERYVSSEVMPGVGFATETEASAAGDRMIKAVTETGRFPNMCELF